MTTYLDSIKRMLVAVPLKYTNVNEHQYCYDLKYGTNESAGLDLYLTSVDNKCIVTSNGTVIGKMYGTNIAVEIPRNNVGLLYLRSSAAKSGYSMLNHVGVIDSDYRGEIKAMLHFDNIIHTYLKFPSDKPILQLVIVPSPQWELTKVKSLNETLRGDGGFGSTDTNLPPTSINLTGSVPTIDPNTITSVDPSASVNLVDSSTYQTVARDDSEELSTLIYTSTDLTANEQPAADNKESEICLNPLATRLIERQLEAKQNRFKAFAQEHSFPELNPKIDRVTQLKQYYEKRRLDMIDTLGDKNVIISETSAHQFDPISELDIIEDINTDPLYRPAH